MTDLKNFIIYMKVFRAVIHCVMIFLKTINVVAMDNLLTMIYDKFIEQLRYLQLGHTFDDHAIEEIYDMIQAYELLDSNTLSSKEQKYILNYYD